MSFDQQRFSPQLQYHLPYFSGASPLPSSQLSTQQQPIDDDDACVPLPEGTPIAQQCAWVRGSDDCQGGGYLQWAAYIACNDDEFKWLLVIGAAVFLALLFVAVFLAADDFFSPNVSVVVSHLGISQTLAGVTIVAFGNGSPDIFTSIASVLSTPSPKADLALGSLLGGCIYVTLVVSGSVAILRPFKAALWSSIRTLVFFVLTLGWILFIFLFDNHLHFWQPIVLLLIYVLYLLSFAADRLFCGRARSRKHRKAAIGKGIASSSVFSIALQEKALFWRVRPSQPEETTKQSGNATWGPSSGLGIIEQAARNEASSSGSEGDATDEEELVIVHHRVVPAHQILRRKASKMMRRLPITSVRDVLADLWERLRPFADLSEEERASKDRLARLGAYIVLPVAILLRLTIPLGEAAWSKPLACIHVVLCPQFILVATHQLSTTPVPGGPGLFVYMFAISVIALAPLLIFTSSVNAPRFYKELNAYVGLFMAVAWIYTVSTEVVAIVTMLGFVSGVQPAVLGLTVLAWSNCIGDVITDNAVARQGYPRMAHAATIAGPIFNLLIGFGLPFSIASLQGKAIAVRFDVVDVMLVTFLAISLLFTSAYLLFLKARLGRLYGFLLWLIYLAFLVFVLLAATNVISM